MPPIAAQASKVFHEVVQEEKFNKLVFHIEKQIPGFQLCSKKESTLMRILSVVLFFNKGFMGKYVTTIYPRVYVPQIPWNSSLESRISVLAHEFVHLRDRKRLGWAFNLLYLSPQIFALFALGAFWNIWWLSALFFLLPLPSPGRAWLEFRAYKVSIAMHWYLGKHKTNTVWLREQFVGSGYYWMFPFKKFVERHILKATEDVESGKFLSPEILEILNVLDTGE
jgi:hypothetical protein